MPATGDGTSNKRRKRRRDLPAPERTATRDELDRWLAKHRTTTRKDTMTSTIAALAEESA